MTLVRFLLWPFSVLYGLIISLRNLLYQLGIFNRTSFDVPIICVGNLSVGGTGKTPHVEWIIRQLQSTYRLALLSRGYRRKTNGYIFANKESTPEIIGDEPYQIFSKFDGVTVAVSENRVLAVPALLTDAPETEVIIMDDGFQHLPIQPGFSIILTDYQHPFYSDWLMPAGRLREFKSAYERAQSIIVTKCPMDMDQYQKDQIIQLIKPANEQSVFFSRIQYGKLKSVFDNQELPFEPIQVIGFAGIANDLPFLKHLKGLFKNVQSISLIDHQVYNEATIKKLILSYESAGNNTIMITTEKDAVKLNNSFIKDKLKHIPIYYLPIEITMDKDDEVLLRQSLIHYIELSQST